VPTIRPYDAADLGRVLALWDGQLGSAFLCPGRFDFILPVRPPDTDAREAIWTGYVGEITDEDVDLAALVAAGELFTPADIEFAADVREFARD
jgi:SpoVK/Ycf46/Vps4 family AAA+-type ATPase